MVMKSLQDLLPPGGWRTTGYVRIPPIDMASANPGQRLLIWVAERRGKLSAANLWLMLMRNPRLLRGFISLAQKLMPFGELERRDTEIVILRVGWNCRARYEWGQHVDIGMQIGLSVDEIARISQGPDAPGWGRRQVALLKAVDEFHHERMVSEPTWQMLTEFFDQRLLLELLMLIGFYEGLAGVLNSTGLPLDAAPEKNMSIAIPTILAVKPS